MEQKILYTIPLFLIAFVYPVYAMIMGKKDKDYLLKNPNKKNPHISIYFINTSCINCFDFLLGFYIIRIVLQF